MFAKAFAFLDDELLAVTMKHVEIMYMKEMEFELRGRFYFSAIWTFLLGNRDKCLTYIRYYYSPYFTKYSLEEHQKRFLPLVNKFRDAFKGEADVWLILNHILNVMLDFAVKVYNGQMPNDDDHAEHVFRVIYLQVLPGEDYDVTYKGKQYARYTQIKAKYNMVTKAEDFFPIRGFNQYIADPDFGNGTQTVRLILLTFGRDPQLRLLPSNSRV